MCPTLVPGLESAFCSVLFELCFRDLYLQKLNARLAPESVSLHARVICSYFPDSDPIHVTEQDQVFRHRVKMCTDDTGSRHKPFDTPQSTLSTTPDTYRRPVNRQCVNTRLTELGVYYFPILLLQAPDLPTSLLILPPDSYSPIPRADEQIVIART